MKYCHQKFALRCFWRIRPADTGCLGVYRAMAIHIPKEIQGVKELQAEFRLPIISPFYHHQVSNFISPFVTNYIRVFRVLSTAVWVVSSPAMVPGRATVTCRMAGPVCPAASSDIEGTRTRRCGWHAGTKCQMRMEHPHGANKIKYMPVWPNPHGCWFNIHFIIDFSHPHKNHENHGGLNHWIRMFPHFHTFSRSQGCFTAHLRTRMGDPMASASGKTTRIMVRCATVRLWLDYIPWHIPTIHGIIINMW